MGKQGAGHGKRRWQWRITQSASTEGVDENARQKALDLWVDLIADVIVKAALKEREQHHPDCGRWEPLEANTVTYRDDWPCTCGGGDDREVVHRQGGGGDS